MAAGAMGFSTSRIILHRDKSGDLTPGTMAQEAEMLALGRAIAAGGGGVFEGAFDFATYDDVPANTREAARMEAFAEQEWHWMTNVASEYRVPFSFACDPRRVEAMRRFNEGAGERLMHAQAFIRPQGSLISMQSRVNPFRFTATYRRLAKEGVIGRHKPNMRVMRSASVREAILRESHALLAGTDRTAKVFKLVLGDERILSRTYKWTSSYEPRAEDSVGATAQRPGVAPHELMYDWITEEQPGTEYAVLWRHVRRARPRARVAQGSRSPGRAASDGGPAALPLRGRCGGRRADTSACWAERAHPNPHPRALGRC